MWSHNLKGQSMKKRFFALLHKGHSPDHRSTRPLSRPFGVPFFPRRLFLADSTIGPWFHRGCCLGWAKSQNENVVTLRFDYLAKSFFVLFAKPAHHHTKCAGNFSGGGFRKGCCCCCNPGTGDFRGFGCFRRKTCIILVGYWGLGWNNNKQPMTTTSGPGASECHPRREAELCRFIAQRDLDGYVVGKIPFVLVQC